MVEATKYGSDTFSFSHDGGIAMDYVLTTDPATTGLSETSTFNLDGDDITTALKQYYVHLMMVMMPSSTFSTRSYMIPASRQLMALELLHY